MTYKNIRRFLDTPPKQKIKLGLGRVRQALIQLGAPQKKYPAVIIGGTNGKGSVTAMLASILTETGYKVGWYTSPHILSYQERFRIDRKMISGKDFIRSFNRIAGRKKALSTTARGESSGLIDMLTAFEIMTLMAFDWFAQEKVDIALLEVGLGGRLDATNVVRPLLSIITNVKHDHHEYLGNTLAKIAREKAGIIKDGIPVITAARRPEALAVIRKTARDKQAPLTVVRPGRSARGPAKWLKGLPGDFQKENLALALAALKTLKKKGWKYSVNNIKAGLSKVAWPGRLEVVRRKPLTILDVGHNPAAALALRQSLAKLWPDYKWDLVLGILSRKDAAGIIGNLAPIAARFYFIPLPGPAWTTNELARLAKRSGRPARCCRSAAEALKMAEKQVRSDSRNGKKTGICLAGSFLTVEAGKLALSSLRKQGSI